MLLRGKGDFCRADILEEKLLKLVVGVDYFSSFSSP